MLSMADPFDNWLGHRKSDGVFIQNISHYLFAELWFHKKLYLCLPIFDLVWSLVQHRFILAYESFAVFFACQNTL